MARYSQHIIRYSERFDVTLSPIGKANVDLNLNQLAINFGNIKVIEKGQLFPSYEEIEVVETI